MKKNGPIALITLTLLLLVAPLALIGCPPHEDLRPRSPAER